MVAIVSGNGLGVANSSASLLGQRGVFGNAGLGAGKDSTLVNIANGNLIARGADEFIAFHGVNLDLTRTYNSQAKLGGAANAWQNGLLKQITNLAGSVNAVGSTVTRVDGDGSTDVFTFDADKRYYKSTDGGGGDQTLTYAAGKWTWHSERTALADKELGAYEVYDSALNGYIVNGGDVTGVRTTYTYASLATTPASYRLTRLTDSGGDSMDFAYTAGNLTKVTIKPASTNAGEAASTAFAVDYTYDTFNRLVTVNLDLTPGTAGDALVYTTVYNYAANADGTPSQRIASITQFDARLGLTMVGRQAFTYDDSNRIKSFTAYVDASDKVGRRTELDYGASDPATGVAMTSVKDPMGNRTAYGYDALGRLVSVDGPAVDGVAQHLAYTYTDGNLTSSIDSRGLRTDYAYDDYGHIIAERDALGNAITRTYAAGSNLLLTESAYLPDNGSGLPARTLTTRYVYDAANRLRYTVTPQGRVTEYQYPAPTQLEHSALRQYANDTFTVPSAADKPVTLAELDEWSKAKSANRTDFTYNMRGQVSKSQRYKDDGTASTAITYTYNAFGQLTGSFDADGTTVYGYDGLGRQLSTSIVKGAAYNTTTTIAGTNITVTASDGSVTVSSYDMLGRLVALQQPGVAGATAYVYDAAGRLRVTTTPDGQKTYLAYDKAGRLAARVDPSGAVTAMLYNSADQVVKTTRYARLLTVPAALEPSADPDVDNDALAALGLAALASGADRSAWNFYDAAGRLVDTVDANATVMHYDYDGLSRLVTTTTRANPADLAVLDKLTAPQLAQMRGVTPLASRYDRSVARQYDGDGLLIGQTDAAGYQTGYRYNGAGLLVETIGYSTADTSGTVAGDLHEYRLYDSQNRLVGNVDSDGYLTEMTYDLSGRVTRRTRYAAPARTPAAATLALVKLSINTTTTLNGASVTVTNAAIDNRSVEYTYTALGQLLSETTTNGAALVSGDRTTYAYDKSGNLTGTTRSTGTADSAKYDALGHVLSETRGGVSTVYTYSAAGLRTSMTEANTKRTLYYYNGDGLPTYTVDDLGTVEQRSYNAFGQPISIRRYAATIDATTLTGGQNEAPLLRLLIAAQSADKKPGAAAADQRTVFYYDQGGRLSYTVAADGQITGTTYDRFSQVANSVHYDAALSAATVLTLATNALATEVNKIVTMNGGDTSSFAYDQKGRLIASVDAVGARTTIGYDAFGRVSWRGQGTALQSYAYDERGQVVDYTDAAGNHVATAYNAFGEAVRVTRRATAGSSVDSVLDSISRTIYNEDGRVAATIDPLGALTTYVYNGDGKVLDQITYKTLLSAAQLSAIDAQARTGGIASGTMLAVVAAGLGAASSSAMDSHQKFAYDTRGRLTTIATATLNPVGGTVGAWSISTRAYDDNDRLVLRQSFTTLASTADAVPAVSASDMRERYVYDDLGRLTDTLTAQTTGKWLLSSQQYDTFGNVLQRTVYAVPVSAATPAAADINSVKKATSNANAVTVYRYDSANRVIFKATALGADAAGLLRWSVSDYRYDASGNLSGSTEYAASQAPANGVAPVETPEKTAGDRVTSYTYDAVNRLSTTTDAVGGITALDYDTRGNVTRRTQKSGLAGDVAHDRVTSTTYDLNDRPRYQIDAAGAVTQNEYDALGRLVATTSYANRVAAGPRDASFSDFIRPESSTEDRTSRYVYDLAGQLRYTVDALGYMTEQRYDGVGRLAQTLRYVLPSRPGAFAGIYTVEQAIKVAAALGASQTTSWTYDARGKMLSSTDAMGYTRWYTYDALGNKTGYTNELSKKWDYTYDAVGRVLTETSPPVQVFYSGDSGATVAYPTRLLTQLSYDTFGNLITRTEAVGIPQQRSTTYVYDLLGRQVQTTLPAAAVYDQAAAPGAAGRTELAAAPHTVTIGYDLLGNATSSIDVAGNTSYKVYDAQGRVRYDLDAAGGVTGYERNGFGDVAALTRYALPLTATEQAALRNGGGLPERLRQSELNRTIKTSYDGLGRAVLVSEPGVLVFDQQTRTNFQSARTTATRYNAYGQAIRQAVYGVRDDGSSTAEAVTRNYYDQRGNKRAEIQALSDVEGARKGYLSTFTYDAAGNQELVTESAADIAAWSDVDFASAVKTDADRVTGYRYDNDNRRIQETRYGWLAAVAGGAAADSITEYKYDATGNQTTVVDAGLASTFTYYDALGRTVAVSKLAPVGNATKTPQSLYKLDAYGNVVVRIDYGSGVLVKNAATVGTAVVEFTAPTASASDRVTLTSYDLRGHAIETTDAEGKTAYTSYDVHGHVAKQWRQVSNAPVGAPVMTAYQVNRYDQLGRAVQVITPGNDNLIAGGVAAATVHAYQYNAFGEMTRHDLPAGLPPGAEQTAFDNAGRAWRTNSGDGVYRITLFDAQGHATVQLRDTSADPALRDRLATLASAKDALTLDTVLRINTRYDMLGRVVDVRQSGDSTVSTLVRDPQSGVWRQQAMAPTDHASNSLLIVGDSADGRLGPVVRYRRDGGAWIDETDTRTEKLNGMWVFNTTGLANGSYEYSISARPDGKPVYERELGRFDIATAQTAKQTELLTQLYVVLLNRAPDLAGLNHYTGLLNSGVSVSQIATGIINDDEGRRTLTGDAVAIVKKIFALAFGRDGADPAADPHYGSDVSLWAGRYGAAVKAAADAAAAGEQANGGGGAGQVMLDLITVMLGNTTPSAALARGQSWTTSRVKATLAYLQAGGNNEATAARIFTAAAIDLPNAVRDATTLGLLEARRGAVAQVYLALFSRPPLQAEMAQGLTDLALGKTIEQLVNGLLDTGEARTPMFYQQWVGQSAADYEQRLVYGIYGNLLRRVPTATEMSAARIAMADSKQGADPAQRRSRFITGFLHQLASYVGQDAGLLAQKQLFNNQLAVALSYAELASGDKAVGTTVIANVTGGLTAAEAVAQALANAVTREALAGAISASAALAAAASPMENMRAQLARLYVVLFNRAPDSAGFAFYLNRLSTPTVPPTPPNTTLIAVANDFLTSAESKKDGGLAAVTAAGTALVPLTDTQFVQRVYTLALGQLPDSTDAKAEIAAFVAQLGGKTRGEVALNIINGLLGFTGLSRDEAAMKARLVNKVAVALVCATDLAQFDWPGTNDPAVGKLILAKVTATDTQSALDAAYTLAQGALKNVAANNIAAANGAATALTSAAGAALLADNAAKAVQSAAATAAAQPSATLRLQVMQMYVGILGRNRESYRLSPDLDGFNFTAGAAATTSLAEVAQSMLIRGEGLLRYPAGMGDGAFVAKLAATLMGTFTATPQRLAAWTAQLGAPASKTRGEIAMSMLDFVAGYDASIDGPEPSGDSLNYLRGREWWFKNVNESLELLNNTQQAATAALVSAVAPVQDDDALLRRLQSAQAAAADVAAATALAMANALTGAKSAGDGSASLRYQITLLYATLLQSPNAPKQGDIDQLTNGGVSADLSAIAQALVVRIGADKLDTNAFVTKLFQLILGRSADALALQFWGGKLNQQVGGVNTRGVLALGILSDYMNYSEKTVEQQLRKADFSNKIGAMLAQEKLEADTTAGSALSAYNTLHGATTAAAAALKAAIDDRDAYARLVKTANAEGAEADVLIANPAAQRSVTHVYWGLRGYSDFAGLVFWTRNIAAGVATRESMIPEILTLGGYASDLRTFIGQLYDHVLGRAGTANEVAAWVNTATASNLSRVTLAIQFLDSAEGMARLTPFVNTQVNSDIQVANTRVILRAVWPKKYDAAVIVVSNASTAYNTAGAAEQPASAASIKAAGTSEALAALVRAYALVVPADRDNLTAAQAAKAVDTALSRNAALHATYNTQLDAYAIAVPAANGDRPAAALAAANATLAAARASVDALYVNAKAAPVLQQRSVLIVQLYVGLMNRPPLLAEMHFWTDRMAAGATAAQIATALMADGGVGSALYPGALGNDAFVTQLYRYALERDFSADPNGLRFWSSQLNGAKALSRAELAVGFLASLPLADNSDSTRFYNRMAAATQALLAEANGSAGPQLQPAILLAQQNLRATAASYNASAAPAQDARARDLVALSRLYVGLLNRLPDAAGVAFWIAGMQKGASLAVIAQQLASSSEGRILYPDGLGERDFLRQVFSAAMGRAPFDVEIAPYIALAGTLPRAEVAMYLLNGVADGPGGNLLEETSRTVFNTKVRAGVDSVAASIGSVILNADLAEGALKAIQAAKPVDRHADDFIEAVVSTLSGAQRHDSMPDQLRLDRWGQIFARTDIDDPYRLTSYSYNDGGQLLTTSRTVDGITIATSSTYDALGNMLSTIDAMGNVNRFVYDANNVVKQEFHADNKTAVASVTYGNDAFGQRLSTTQNLNGGAVGAIITLYAYDRLGRQKSRSSAAVDAWYAPELHASGKAPDMQVLLSLAKVNMVDSYEYDELGRRIASTQSSATNFATVNSYSVVDLNKTTVTRVRYDLSGNIIASIDALGYQATTAYDALNHKIASRDAEGGAMAWQVDAFGRVTGHDDLAGRHTQYSYDNAGLLTGQSHTTSAGQDLAYRYADGRLIEIADRVLHQVTSYTYDASGNRLTEKVWLTDAGRALQDNTNTYDGHGRLIEIASAVSAVGADYRVKYQYDNNGNRLKVTTTYNNALGGLRTITVDNTFDAMNRQISVGGGVVTTYAGKEDVGNAASYHAGDGAIESHTITYDWAGNRSKDVYGAQSDSYNYDAAGRLSTVTNKAGAFIAARKYDGAGRVIESLDNGEVHVNAYDRGGRLLRQRFAAVGNKGGMDFSQGNYINDIFYLSDITNNVSGYDKMGNLMRYQVLNGIVVDKAKLYVNTYGIEGRFDSYQVTSTVASAARVGTVTVNKQYDVNGHLAGTDGKDGRALLSDSDGRILEKTQNGVVTHTLMANGEVIGSSNEQMETFSSGFESINSPALSAAPSVYIVRAAGETLQAIAKAVWGDSRLWYLIADANGGIDDKDLQPGQPLNLPSRVNTLLNGAQTFKPYNAADAVGDTTPKLPTPSQGGGCGAVGKLIMVAVAVAVTIYTAGVLAGPTSGFLATMTAGAGALTGGGFAAYGAVAAAAGSVASQAVGIAIGAQDGFSWESVARSALGGAGSGGLPANVGGFGNVYASAVARAAVSSVAVQGLSIVSGLQNGFDWRGVAAASAGAVAGQAFSGSTIFGNSALAQRTVSGFAAGTTAAIMRGGKIDVARIATDAFGNALGSSLAARSSGTPDLSADDWDKIKQSTLSGPRLASGFGGEPNTQSDVATLGDMTYASARAAERSAYVATVIGADIVDGIPSVTVPRPGPSWIQRNILTPAGQLISQVGDVLSDAGQGFLSWANDTFVRPSGSTDEMPQYFQYSRPSAADVDATQRAINSYRPYYPSGPAFVAVDPAREASARAQAQRNGNNLAMAFGGYFVAGPMLAARQYGLNETQVGEAGMLGLSLQELAGARGTGPRPPSLPISRAPTTSLTNSGVTTTATAAVSGTAASRKSGFIFRGDDRGPDVIFNEGFQPRGANTDLLKYAESNVPSVYVPATTSPNVARYFAEIQGGGYVYTMRGQPNGVDVNSTLGKLSPHPNEFEIAVPGGIHPFDIMGARPVDPNGDFIGPFIKNPKYTP